MAPPIEPIDQGTIDSYTTATEAANKLGSVFNSLSDFTSKAANVLRDLSKNIAGVSGNLSQMAKLSEESSMRIGMLTTAAIGARDAFTSMGNIDTSGLNLFVKQIKDVEQILLSGDNLSSQAATQFRNAVANLAQASGLQMPLNMGITGLANFAINMLRSADNALKLQTAIIQLSAQTGELDEVYGSAGEKLDNLNSVLAIQNKIMNDTAKATQLPDEAVQQYYLQLGTIPKALSSVITTSHATGATTSMLTATIQMATGSGRKFTDVVDDLHFAFKQYNAVGEDSLKFTARIAEISRNYGIELEDVRKSLRQTAEAFRDYGAAGENAGKMLESAAKVTNQYINALQSSGLSGERAAEITAQITAQVSRLNLAQKAFISAQTGGPGGLIGAFQIEKMMKEGDIEGVMNKMRATFMRQFGRIISLEEASKSPAAAAQLTRQITFLQQGPLGGFAKTDQDAVRILEAFDKIGKGKAGTKELAADILQKSMDKGAKLQETMASDISIIRTTLQNIQASISVKNLGFIQSAIGVRPGFTEVPTDAEANARGKRAEVMATGRETGGKTARTWQKGKGTRIEDVTGESLLENLNNLSEYFSTIENTATVLKDKFTSTWKSQTAEVQRKRNEQKASWLRASAALKAAANDRKNAMKEKDRAVIEFQANRIDQLIKEGEESGYFYKEEAPAAFPAPGKDIIAPTSAKKVGAAVPSAVKTATPTAPTTAPTAALQPSTEPEKKEVSVTVRGLCFKCLKELETSAQSNANVQGTTAA